jgi:hypothetical protein
MKRTFQSPHNHATRRRRCHLATDTLPSPPSSSRRLAVVAATAKPLTSRRRACTTATVLAIWLMFKTIVAREKDKEHPDVECIYCSTRLNNAQRTKNLEKHLRQHCPRVPGDVKDALQSTPLRRRRSNRGKRTKSPRDNAPQKKRASTGFGCSSDDDILHVKCVLFDDFGETLPTSAPLPNEVQ